MKQMEIRIGFQTYTLACSDGEEGRLGQLADEIDARARSIKEKTPRASESMVLVMTALMLADELYEARQEAGMLHEKLAMGLVLDGNGDGMPPIPSAGMVARNLTMAMNEIADQLDAITATVENR
ncbi:MAG: cell division protein ZapA [Rickettsiales bacterium]|nr:cell division protein ZapA [Rickettsiales bacterium]